MHGLVAQSSFAIRTGVTCTFTLVHPPVCFVAMLVELLMCLRQSGTVNSSLTVRPQGAGLGDLQVVRIARTCLADETLRGDEGEVGFAPLAGWLCQWCDDGNGRGQRPVFVPLCGRIRIRRLS
jgi:hypothetical protein